MAYREGRGRGFICGRFREGRGKRGVPGELFESTVSCGCAVATWVGLENKLLATPGGLAGFLFGGTVFGSRCYDALGPLLRRIVPVQF